MPRFNNGMSGRNGAGNGMGNGTGSGMGRGQGRGQGQRANCRGNGQGLGFGASNANWIGQSPAGQRNPGFFRRFCLGLTDPSGAPTAPRRSGILSAIDDLQRQIDTLKNSTAK